MPSDDTTLLCDLDESYTGEVGVKPLFLAKMFPNCHSIKWSGVVRSGSDTAALFECAQCKQYFSKNLELRERTGVFNNIGNQFRVCKRAEGTFECGPLCRRKEIPDCEQFTISKVDVVKQTSTSVTAYYDAGYFYCNSPIHGMVSMQVPTYASTDMDRKKLITELSDNGAEVQCIPQINFVDFPHCLRYTAVETSFGLKYKCLQCRSGFIAEENPASYRNLCKPVDIYNAVPDAYWQFEVPNCLQISRTNTKKGSDGSWNARYECTKCADGYEPNTLLEGIDLRLDGSNYRDFVKPLCVQKQNPIPSTCDEQCKKRYPRCNKIKFEIGLSNPIQTDIGVCTECEQGYSLSTSSTSEYREAQPYFAVATKTMCVKNPTNGPVPCDQDCKRNFPWCDSISVSVQTTNGTSSTTYRCHQCQSGYYPIMLYSMDPNESGSMKQEDADRLSRSDKLYLCSQNERTFVSGIVTVGVDNFFEGLDDCNVIGLISSSYSRLDGGMCLECKNPDEESLPVIEVLYSKVEKLCRPKRSAQRGGLNPLKAE